MQALVSAIRTLARLVARRETEDADGQVKCLRLIAETRGGKLVRSGHASATDVVSRIRAQTAGEGELAAKSVDRRRASCLRECKSLEPSSVSSSRK